jgi:rare lipoprotein A
MRSTFENLVLSVLLATPLAHAKAHHPKEKHPANHQRLEREQSTGIASWYGKEHQGRMMADGHPFDRFKLTAASRSLPFGTRITVTNVANDSAVVVTVTDRGPWVKSRILDLSEAAAKAIACNGVCTIRITPEIVEP